MKIGRFVTHPSGYLNLFNSDGTRDYSGGGGAHLRQRAFIAAVHEAFENGELIFATEKEPTIDRDQRLANMIGEAVARALREAK